MAHALAGWRELRGVGGTGAPIPRRDTPEARRRDPHRRPSDDEPGDAGRAGGRDVRGRPGEPPAESLAPHYRGPCRAAPDGGPRRHPGTGRLVAGGASLNARKQRQLFAWCLAPIECVRIAVHAVNETAGGGVEEESLQQSRRGNPL